jgi:rhodanese-related sulfurtransferase
MSKKRLTLTIAVLSAFCVTLVTTGCVTSKEMTAKEMVAEAKKECPSIPPEDAKARMDKGGYIFLDVREPKEFKKGHVPGAINIPRGVLEFKITKKIPDKNAKILIFCKTGGRATLAGSSIKRMGYKNVTNVDGGWEAWSKKKFPVE